MQGDRNTPRAPGLTAEGSIQLFLRSSRTWRAPKRPFYVLRCYVLGSPIEPALDRTRTRNPALGTLSGAGAHRRDHFLVDHELALGIVNRQHRTSGPADDRFGDAADENTRDAFAAVGAHHDEIDRVTLRALDDLLRWMTDPHDVRRASSSVISSLESRSPSRWLAAFCIVS